MTLDQITQAYGYLRVSSEGQEDGDGWDRQERAVRAFSDRMGIEVLDLAKDAYTGTEADRPELAALFLKMAETGVRVMIVERMDRVARDIVVSEVLIREMQAQGITLIEAASGLVMTDSDSIECDPTRKLIRQLLAVIAEFDKDSLVGKLRSARRAKARETGRPVEGRKRYGYPKNDPEATTLEQGVLLRMLKLWDAGLTGKQIADVLNEEGTYNRKSQPWNRGHIWRIVNTELQIIKDVPGSSVFSMNDIREIT